MSTTVTTEALTVLQRLTEAANQVVDQVAAVFDRLADLGRDVIIAWHRAAVGLYRAAVAVQGEEAATRPYVRRNRYMSDREAHLHAQILAVRWRDQMQHLLDLLPARYHGRARELYATELVVR